jgi:hypothetical protein
MPPALQVSNAPPPVAIQRTPTALAPSITSHRPLGASRRRSRKRAVASVFAASIASLRSLGKQPSTTRVAVRRPDLHSGRDGHPRRHSGAPRNARQAQTSRPPVGAATQPVALVATSGCRATSERIPALLLAGAWEVDRFVTACVPSAAAEHRFRSGRNHGC